MPEQKIIKKKYKKYRKRIGKRSAAMSLAQFTKFNYPTGLKKRSRRLFRTTRTRALQAAGVTMRTDAEKARLRKRKSE